MFFPSSTQCQHSSAQDTSALPGKVFPWTLPCRLGLGSRLTHTCNWDLPAGTSEGSAPLQPAVKIHLPPHTLLQPQGTLGLMPAGGTWGKWSADGVHDGTKERCEPVCTLLTQRPCLNAVATHHVHVCHVTITDVSRCVRYHGVVD